MTIYSLLIVIFWFTFFAYWLVSAMSAKKRVKGNPHSRSVGFRIVTVVVIVLILQLPGFQNFAIYYNTLFSYVLVNVLGILICGSGIAFAIWARMHLGRNWGMPMSIQEKSELVTSGPYAFVRHPIYTGMIVALFGSMLMGVDSFLWLALFIFSFAYFVYSSRVEDGLMEQQFGQTYLVYKKETKALIPFIF